MSTTHIHSALDSRIGRKSPHHRSFLRPFQMILRSSDIPQLRQSLRTVSRYEKIWHWSHNVKTISALCHAALADLGKIKDALGDQKGVFNLGAHTRLSTVLLALTFSKHFAFDATYKTRWNSYTCKRINGMSRSETSQELPRFAPEYRYSREAEEYFAYKPFKCA